MPESWFVNGNTVVSSLRKLVRFSRADLWWGELALAFAGAAGAVWISIAGPEQVDDVASFTGSLVGVVIGAVIAAIAILTAPFNREFLRKLTAIDRNAEDYLAPFVITALMGIAAVILIPIWSVLAPTGNTTVRALLGALAGALSFWTLASLVTALGTLVQFVQLLQLAADVPDDETSSQNGPSQEGGTGDGPNPHSGQETCGEQ
jgi:gas vesicle protein